METRLRAPLEGVVVFLLGLLPAFFLAFNVVFADAFGFADHALGVTVVLVGYLVFGVVVGLVTRTDVRLQAGALAAGAFVLLAWYTTHEPGNLLYHVVVLLAAVLGAFGGVFLGRHFRRPHGAENAA